MAIRPERAADHAEVFAPPLGFHYESEAFDAGFQVIELDRGVLSGAGGFVRYPPAFAEV